MPINTLGDWLNYMYPQAAMPVSEPLGPKPPMLDVSPGMGGKSGQITNPGGPPGPPPPRIVSSKKMQDAVLRNEWMRHGPDKDFEEVWQTPAGDRAWRKLVDAHNNANGTNFDPDNMPHNSSTAPIFDAFENAYLKGKKAKFPGVDDANEFFENSGLSGHAAYLPGDEGANK